MGRRCRRDLVPPPAATPPAPPRGRGGRCSSPAPALATVTFGAMAIPWPKAVDLGDNAYWLIVTALMTSITLAATGLLMGLVVVVERRRTRALGTSPA